MPARADFSKGASGRLFSSPVRSSYRSQEADAVLGSDVPAAVSGAVTE